MIRPGYGRARGLLLVALVTGIAGCASSPEESAGEELHTGSTYRFSGGGAGETVEGSIFFADEGGYLVRSSHGTCDHTGGSRGAAWNRAQQGNRTWSVRCQNLMMRMTVEPDGDIRKGVATIRRTEIEERRGSCVEYDTTTGACIRWNWISVPVTRSYDVSLTFTAG